jgi:integrase
MKGWFSPMASKNITAKAKRGDGVFYRDGSLYISWTSATGKRMKRRANGDLLAEARNDRAEEIRKVNQARIYGITPPTDKTFAVVAQEHLAKQKPRISDAGFRRESDIIRLHLEPYFTGPLADIKHGQIQKYVTMRESERSAATVCKELNIIKNIFSFAVAHEYLPASPASEVRGPAVHGKEQNYIAAESFPALIAACPAWLRPIVAFGAATGIRLGNIIALEWRNVDLENQSLRLPKTKNGEALTIQLTELAMRVLSAVAAHRIGKASRVFGYEGRHNRVSVEFRRAAKRAGIDAHFHTLRHSFCAHSLMVGNDGITVQKQLGHKTASMTSRYAHLSPGFLKGAAGRMDTVFSGITLDANHGTQMGTNGVQLLKQGETTGNN